MGSINRLYKRWMLSRSRAVDANDSSTSVVSRKMSIEPTVVFSVPGYFVTHAKKLHRGVEVKQRRP